MYSLKMGLRVINGQLADFKVDQYGTSGVSMDDYNDQTMIECWHIASSNSEKNYIEQEFNLPFDRNGS